jgi:hypothetical protein
MDSRHYPSGERVSLEHLARQKRCSPHSPDFTNFRERLSTKGLGSRLKPAAEPKLFYIIAMRWLSSALEIIEYEQVAKRAGL